MQLVRKHRHSAITPSPSSSQIPPPALAHLHAVSSASPAWPTAPSAAAPAAICARSCSSVTPSSAISSATASWRMASGAVTTSPIWFRVSAVPRGSSPTECMNSLSPTTTWLVLGTHEWASSAASGHRPT